ETTALSVYNRSKDTTPSCCSSDWLIQLQQSWCPLLRLLILGIVTLPIYNVVLILVGWRVHRNIRSSAETVVRQPPPVPPKPPPRLRRRSGVTPPQRSSSPEVGHDSVADQEPYRILRRNLQLVLRGLQNPPLEIAPPRIPSELPSDMTSLCPSEYPRSETQKKRSKVIFKRLWQRWRSRSKLKKSKKPLLSGSSSSCCSTNGSSCFYVY
ncbi:hypothetical protein KR038_007056, partial [Drosophila bunnanda]